MVAHPELEGVGRMPSTVGEGGVTGGLWVTSSTLLTSTHPRPSPLPTLPSLPRQTVLARRMAPTPASTIHQALILAYHQPTTVHRAPTMVHRALTTAASPPYL